MGNFRSFKKIVPYFYYYVGDLNGLFSFHYYIFLFVSKILSNASTALLELRPDSWDLLPVWKSPSLTFFHWDLVGNGRNPLWW